MKNLKILFSLLTVAAIFQDITAQELQLGSCIDKEGVVNLNMEKFMEPWYEYGRTPRFLEEFGKCIAFEFHQPDKEKWPFSILMVTDIFNIKTNLTENYYIEGDGKGKSWQGYEITFVDVDYDDYVVIYACRHVLIFPKQEIIWILTRKRFPEEETIIKAYDAALDFGLSLDQFRETDQMDCPDISEFN